MNNIAKMTICLFIVAVLAAPAIAGAPHKGSYASQISGTLYRGGTTVLESTEGLFAGCLKNTFGLFNPCLDFVKGSTNIVLAPLDMPFAYFEKGTVKTKAKGVSQVPAPKKPEFSK